MDKDYIEQGVDFNCLPEIVFKAWLDSKQHGEMIDGNAKIEPIVGGNFSIWDASITGITTKIDKTKLLIEQDWRYDYDDWPKAEPSKLTLQFLPITGGTKMVLKQTNIPNKYKEDIADGWNAYYYKPMSLYFNK